MSRDKALFKKIELTSGETMAIGDGSKSIVKRKLSIEISDYLFFRMFYLLVVLKLVYLALSNFL